MSLYIDSRLSFRDEESLKKHTFKHWQSAQSKAFHKGSSMRFELVLLSKQIISKKKELG